MVGEKTSLSVTWGATVVELNGDGAKEAPTFFHPNHLQIKRPCQAAGCGLQPGLTFLSLGCSVGVVRTSPRKAQSTSLINCAKRRER